jgi:hypothetical protein
VTTFAAEVTYAAVDGLATSLAQSLTAGVAVVPFESVSSFF